MTGALSQGKSKVLSNERKTVVICYFCFPFKIKSFDIFTFEILKSMLLFGNSDSLLEIDGGITGWSLHLLKQWISQQFCIFKTKKYFYTLIPYSSYPKTSVAGEISIIYCDRMAKSEDPNQTAPNMVCLDTYELWHGISNNVVCAASKASDQPAHMRV